MYCSQTFKLEPQLATHWRILDDSMTFLFRINPNARFSDGREVIAQDVVATYDILTDEGHGDPTVYTEWKENFSTPIAVSKYIVSIKANRVDWRTFGNIAEQPIYPSFYLNKIDGAAYIEKYQFEMMPGTGPYEIDINQVTREDKDYINTLLHDNIKLYLKDIDTLPKIIVTIIKKELTIQTKISKSSLILYSYN